MAMVYANQADAWADAAARIAGIPFTGDDSPHRFKHYY
jgi:hypothetical protein